MKIEDLAERRFFHEVERRREIHASLSVPLGVLTALFAAIAAMLSSLRIPFTAWEISLLTVAVLGFVCGLASVYFAMRAYVGYVYKHLPVLAELKNWRGRIVGLGYSEREADDHVRRAMLDRYIVAADHNSANNNRKAAYLHRSALWLAAFLVLTVTSGVPYTWMKMSEPETLKSPLGPPNTGPERGAATHE
jgi:hypothetical protein